MKKLRPTEVKGFNSCPPIQYNFHYTKTQFSFSPCKFKVWRNFFEDFINIPFLVSTLVPSWRKEEVATHTADGQGGGLTMTSS